MGIKIVKLKSMIPYPFTTGPAFDFPQIHPYYFSNFGYWEKDFDYPTAAKKMAILTGDAAGLNQDSKLLEIGSGLGGSVFVWAKDFCVPEILAVNLEGEQSKFAKDLIAKEKLESVIWQEGDWKIISDLKDSTFTHIICLDCIYHFQDKSSFYKEVKRLLKPNGKFVFTDLTFPRSIGRFSLYYKFLEFLTSVALVPKENQNTNNQTLQTLDEIGFKIIRTAEWGEFVYPGFAEFTKSQAKSLQIFANTILHFYHFGFLNYQFYVVEKSEYSL
ncbi:SAM-dependent methyltransferase [Leptospira ilyithenensis]|uniref:Class I SAM-dependent methyltransferase n=1 Tax=Leptospira ilyithenensis TaxID=2484901 RepID=A0A4R9LP18_9LEPT|nr:class I SAM-dependent methyltransferase [Leptospira ilyithenensis]TGN10515.1 class I SAM-dependent methyltransferase [Leptospira ilyithenensis]